MRMEKEPWWKRIAELYKKERADLSLNALLLDKYVLDVARQRFYLGGRVLDHGAGTGIIAIKLAAMGWDVFAVEPNEHMRKTFIQSLPDNLRNRIKLTAELTKDHSDQPFDLILSLNVLDFIEYIEGTIRKLRTLISPNGLAVLSIPHPLKDLGNWIKEKKENQWEYLYYRLNGYLKEGMCSKIWEDHSGNIIVDKVLSYHKKISTYFNSIQDAGFEVTTLREPEPLLSDKERAPIQFTKCSRIPYFLVFECRPKEKGDSSIF